MALLHCLTNVRPRAGALRYGRHGVSAAFRGRCTSASTRAGGRLDARNERQSVDCTRLLHSEEQTCPRTSQAVVARVVVHRRAVVVDLQVAGADVPRARAATALAALAVTAPRAAVAVAPVAVLSAAVPAGVSVATAVSQGPATHEPPAPGWPPRSRSSPNRGSPKA